MLRFLIRRLLLAILTLTVVSMIAFGMFFAVPADPARLQCGDRCTADQLAAVEERLGINEPIVQQYGEFMQGIFVGRTLGEGDDATNCPAPCLGESFLNSRLVTDVVVDAMPVTASIALGTWVIQITLGVSLGVIAALKRGTIIDKVAIGAALTGSALPIYFFGAILLLVFRYTLEWVPQPAYIPPTQSLGDWAAGMLLPWCTVALINFTFEARMTRSQMLETLDEDFIRTSRAKGLRNSTVYGRHALRASITPIATSAGLSLGLLLGGAVVTEQIFGLPGLGKASVDAVHDGNLPVVMATVLIAATFIVISTLVVDLIYAVIDPRVRLG